MLPKQLVDPAVKTALSATKAALRELRSAADRMAAWADIDEYLFLDRSDEIRKLADVIEADINEAYPQPSKGE